MSCWLFVGLSIALSQENEHSGRGGAQKSLEPPVTFLQSPPIMDGILDESLSSLPVRQFSTVDRNASDPVVPSSYRIAYGAGFFYLYLEARAVHLVYRDRAYQNGDGFVLLIAKARPDGGRVDEFYELACSAVNKQALEWTRRIIWNYNVNKIFIPTSDETILEFHEGGGRISFELLLPWSDVRPNHPWLPDPIGFNLTFTKAVEPTGRMFYSVVDDNVGAEYQTRGAVTLRFQDPAPARPQTYVTIPQGHITEGIVLRCQALTAASNPGRDTVRMRLLTGEGRVVARTLVDYDCKPGITRFEFPANTGNMMEGGYQVRWESSGDRQRGAAGLSVLPQFDPAALALRLGKTESVLAPSSFSTMQFFIDEIGRKLAALKLYETCAPERLSMRSLVQSLSIAERGEDPFAGKTGFLRKAYRSKVDSTLQPYVVYVPERMSKTKRYPLLVYLHGSASDETNIQGAQRMIPEGFVAVGPFGRGGSNSYARDHAQDDIAEVIDAVESDYPIDSTRILLSGFSMGGYGVYRTVFETPGRFRGAAVFSGGPDLGRRYAPDSHPPDFSDEQYLTPFRGLPMFIFHGERDMNIPIGATRELIRKLKNIGAVVEECIEADKGHEQPGDEGIRAFKRWARTVAGEEQ